MQLHTCGAYRIEWVLLAPSKPNCLQTVFATSFLVLRSQHMGISPLLTYTWTNSSIMMSPFII